MLLPIYIHEAKKDRLYRVPAIDNRRRTGYNIWRAVMEHYGPGTHRGRLYKLDGSKVEVEFTWSGWGELGKLRL